MRENNVDLRLLGHFERSWERQDQTRRILPERWLTDERPAAQQLNELFIDLIERARTRVNDERDAFAMQQLSAVDARD